MSGQIEAIFVAAQAAADPQSADAVQIDAGKGIVGDRYYGKGHDDQITLVDADVIDQVNAATGWRLTPEETRRNVVTRGIDLNQFETSRFRLGNAVLEGVELCEPCAILGRILTNEQRSAPDIVKALTHKAGLRARVVEGGVIRRGDELTALDK